MGLFASPNKKCLNKKLNEQNEIELELAIKKHLTFF